MTIDPTNTAAPNIVERAKNILLQPQKEWDQIATEPADVNQIYVGYVLPLAALSAICSFIGMSLIGVMGFKIGLAPGLIGAVIQVVMALVGVFTLAFVTNMLAPNFGSQQDIGQAHKLAAYSSTAGFLAGVFTILPALAILAIVGLYSFVLLFIGLPRMMKTPQDKRVGYFVTIIIVCIVVAIVLSVVMGAVRGMIPGYAPPTYTFGQNGPSPAEGHVTLPGGGAVDIGELQRQAEALQGGGGTTIDPALVQAQLPQSLPGGFALTSSSS
ncbi:MAG TPA: Yip1 family protein, partial [Candidatus Binatia bacterium]|nr:Yip1 family protein [Candidatus Binatia bacterium]